MSLYSALQTSVSGMAAQANALSAVSDNIANSSTTGYKRASTEFETVLGNEATSSYESGSVLTDTRYGVTDQGSIVSTTSSTDLAIKGNGFFIVSTPPTPGSTATATASSSYLTRAGSFAPDANGNLVNSAGFSLMGYKVTGSTTSPTLSVVNVSSSSLQATASSTGTFTANVPSATTAVAAAALPSTDSASATYSQKSSITLYDNLGKADVYDVYLSKVSDTAATGSSNATSTWEVTAYNSADAAAGGGFPYTSGSTNDTPATVQLTFDSTTGSLTTASNSSLTIPVTNGNSVKIDLSGMTQLATSFSVNANKADGNAPSKLSSVSIGTDGTLSEIYASGAQVTGYKIPLATVNSPDNLTSLSGNVYQTNADTGNMVVSSATTNGTGSILGDSLESSTVDLATELTNMIQAQRGYESNSKVLQAASDLLHTLTQLQL